MPTKRTAKKLRYTLSKAQADFAPTIASASTGSASCSRRQESKALDLPLELLREIISYFNCFPDQLIPSYASDEQSSLVPRDPRTYLERRNVLRSLSQTCRYWRDIFFPILWEHLNTAHSEMPGQWYMALGESMIKKSLLLSKNPEIAAHVQYVPNDSSLELG